MGEVRFSHGRGDNGLFQESAEHKAAATRGAPVEPKRELLQVGLEMVGGDRIRALSPFNIRSVLGPS